MDCVTLLTGALAIASLLPLIPMAVVPLLSDVFEVFNRLVIFTHNKSGTCTFCSLDLLYCFTFLVAVLIRKRHQFVSS